MNLALDQTAELLDAVPKLDLSCIRAAGGRKGKYARARQKALIRYVVAAHRGDRQHKTQCGATAFTKTELVASLKVDTKGKREQALLRPFFSFPEGNRGYSKADGVTKPYTLNGDVQATLDTLVERCSPCGVICPFSGDAIDTATLPTNGIPAHLADRLSVPALLKIHENQIERALQWVQEGIEKAHERVPLSEDFKGPTLGDARTRLRYCLQWVRSIGGLPNFYREVTSGRLCPCDPYGLHMIQLPKRLRHLLYTGTGMHDYDLENCHVSIFRDVARAVGVATPRVDEYLGDRARIIGRWQGITREGEAADYKAVVLSLLNGGKLVPSPYTAAGAVFSKYGIRTLQRDSFMKSLMQEIRRGLTGALEGIPKETQHGETVIVNAVGKARPFRGDDLMTEGCFGKAASHLLTGLEQWTMREVCGGVTNLQAIIYDGFIAPKQDVADLNVRLADRATGFMGVQLNLRMKETSLSDPVPEAVDDGDF